MRYQITVNPLKAFNTTSDKIADACGILPVWAVTGGAATMKDSLLLCYPYYGGEITGATIDEDGRMNYPGDEPSKPLLQIERFNETDELQEVCLIYQYAIVACKDIETGVVWMTRMD